MNLSEEEAREYYMIQCRYCDDHDLPVFAPPSGVCYMCSHQIFGGRFGFSKEQAGSMLITYCPYCDFSFVD